MIISEHLLGRIMPEVSTQITQIVFIALLLVPSLITLGGVIYAAVIVMPALLKQGQQLIDNNTNLTKATENTEKSLAGITPELVKQTNSIDKVVVEIRSQSLDFRNYQTLVSDGLTNHDAKIDANTLRLTKLELAFADLPKQIIAEIKDEFTCETILKEFQSLRAEVTRAIFQQQKTSTGTFPAVPKTTPPTPVTTETKPTTP